MKPWLLKFHRWVALVFALPLVLVLSTGLILSFEPWLVTQNIEPGSLTAARVEALLSKHDPKGTARAINYRSYDTTLSIRASDGARNIDVKTGELRSAPSTTATVLRTARRMHETLLIDGGVIVLASAIAMLAMAVFGILLGWPRFANTLSGWHKAIAWGLLPLIILSPLTGVLLAFRISLAEGRPPPPAKADRLKLVEAVRIVGGKYDLSAMVWVRQRRGRMLARIVDNGEYRVFEVTKAGIVPTGRNWPRLWHEGNFAGAWSAVMNVVLSIAMLGLLVTGTWIWTRRKLRRMSRRASGATKAVQPN